MSKPNSRNRKGPKSTRAGCLLCKPHKRQGVDHPKRQEIRARAYENDKPDEDVPDSWLFEEWETYDY